VNRWGARGAALIAVTLAVAILVTAAWVLALVTLALRLISALV
jgi:hypothetical protein